MPVPVRAARLLEPEAGWSPGRPGAEPRWAGHTWPPWLGQELLGLASSRQLGPRRTVGVVYLAIFSLLLWLALLWQSSK